MQYSFWSLIQFGIEFLKDMTKINSKVGKCVRKEKEVDRRKMRSR